MKTSKNNLEYQIKKKIDEREIAPSRDLWSEIETHTHRVEDTQTKKINWFLVAACLVLMMSLGAVLIFNENKPSDIQVAQKETMIKDPIAKPKTENNPEIIQQNQEKFDKVENLASTKPEVITPKIIVDRQQNLSIIKENSKEIAAQISQIPAEKILAKADSAKVQLKKKRYVDPSTLLFSVEHKEVIEKTKDGSNVAKVDLNSK
ncbi:hypothetical protein CHRY9390_01671 [Chryseobacterium aquaeductus]|uniref:Uncharacterized protein n=1 Tax=Chryseobacterium aquaeductus TaxID=2675056 RepID=A0A9N8MGZ6_9FLAO|nr:hypothetical protein [Chryseobacterium aquaeductus]CAA7330992.1 hypothetical protein CHRY9390_01671 [Chryseobacterium potabilaquae]CAD7807528.1 hypothetical protein CHRY9390_01671 [Chryseobacterium aquaeductus]